ncbi:MAG: recombinase family protein [Patescibacteria group bacterium]
MASSNSYFLYVRKSSEDVKRQVLSLDSQEEAMRELAEREGIKIVETFRESKSAKDPGRPVFNDMVTRLRAGEAQGILSWKMDRLARNPIDAGSIQWLLQTGTLTHIKTIEGDHFSGDNVLMTAFQFGAANQYVLDLSKNVKRGLGTKNDMGIRPGRAPLGYKNSEKKIISDPERFELVKRAWHLMLTGNFTPPEILRIATDEWGLRTLSGKPIARSAIYTLFGSSFYYGSYEYAGRVWAGTHEPMITEEEYWRVQELLGRKGRERPKQTPQFDFTGLMRCGNCDAMITAENKTKRFKNGTSKHYVYYHCTWRKDPSCTERSIELNELSRQIDGIISTLTINDRFKTWAIKHLHEVRKNQTATRETSLDNKQKLLSRTVAQLNSLNLRYTSPENIDGSVLSTEEYQELKSPLLEQKQSFERALISTGQKIEEEVELSERTFNFARYAHLWFKNGDRNTRRAIFSALGSNLVLTNQKVVLNLHPVFKAIADNAIQIEAEFDMVRTRENSTDTGQNAETYAFSPTLLRD